VEAYSIDDNIITSVKQKNRKLFLSSLKRWFRLIKENPPNNQILLDTNALVSGIILYVIEKEYKIFFEKVDLKLSYLINEAILIRIYENTTHYTMECLRDELRLEITEEFKKAFYELGKAFGTARIIEILNTLKEEKIGKVFTKQIVDGFYKYFVDDFSLIFNLYSKIKKQRGQPKKYSESDFAKLNDLIEEGYKQKRAAKIVLWDKGLSEEHIQSFLKLNRERLPLRNKLRLGKSGN